MITIEEFIDIYNKLDAEKEPEIEFAFSNRNKTYMITKYVDMIWLQSIGYVNGKHVNEIKEYKTLEELLYSTSLDGLVLAKEWNYITDIVVNTTFSLNSPEEVNEMFNHSINYRFPDKSETKWYLIDEHILGRTDRWGHFIFNNGRWENYEKHLIGDCLIGYDPTEDDFYAIGNMEIMDRIKEISESEAVAIINKSRKGVNK